MRKVIALAVAAASIPMAAWSQPAQRFSDVQYIRAAKCAAYGEAPALKGEAGNTAWLAAALKAQRGNREPYILTKAGDEARDIERAGRKANTEEKIAALRAERTNVCAGFARTDNTQAGAPAAPGG